MAAQEDLPLFKGRCLREHRSTQKMLLMNRKEWEEGKGGFQGKFGQVALGSWDRVLLGRAALSGCWSCQGFSALTRQLLLLPLSPMWCSVLCL